MWVEELWLYLTITKVATLTLVFTKDFRYDVPGSVVLVFCFTLIDGGIADTFFKGTRVRKTLTTELDKESSRVNLWFLSSYSYRIGTVSGVNLRFTTSRKDIESQRVVVNDVMYFFLSLLLSLLSDSEIFYRTLCLLHSQRPFFY